MLWFIGMVAVILALFVSGCSSPPARQSRSEYQSKLNTSPARFDASAQVISKSGRLYIKKDVLTTQDCLKLCGTIEPNNPKDPHGEVKVTLPIGFRIEANMSLAEAGAPITELTYWNPFSQAVEAIPYEKDRAVKVPSSLVSRTVNDLAKVKEGFIQGVYVHPTHNNSFVVERDAPLWHEELGLEYGMTVTVKITEDNRKVSVCVPPGTAVSSTVMDDGIPASNSC